MELLKNRVAIVTGGGQGLGRAHSIELARQGAHVVIADAGVSIGGEATTTSPADAVVSEIIRMGGTASAVRLSVADFDAVGGLVDEVVSEHSRLDIVVNNAGITRDRMLVNMTSADFSDVLAVHAGGTFALSHHAARHWRAESKAGRPVSGRVINTTSGAGMTGNVGQLSYSAAKAAVGMMTVVSAMELQRYGVTVNAIAPVARTRMTESGGGFASAPQVGGFDHFDPANASPVVAYLASEGAGWISGQIIRIDGNLLRAYSRSELTELGFRPIEDRPLDAADIHDALRALFKVLPLGLGDSRIVRS